MNSSSEITSSGGKANKTGGGLQKFVEEILKQEGYEEFWYHKEQMFANRTSVGGKQFAKEVIVGETIYGKQRRVDCLVLNKSKFPDGLIIECKWQQSGGSVDEKYPFLYFNIMKTRVPTIILLDGGGYSNAAGEWLRGQANPDGALIGVYDMAEFRKKVNNGLLS